MKLYDAFEKLNSVEREVKEAAVRGDARHLTLEERLEKIEANIDYLFEHLKLKKVK